MTTKVENLIIAKNLVDSLSNLLKGNKEETFFAVKLSSVRNELDHQLLKLNESAKINK